MPTEYILDLDRKYTDKTLQLIVDKVNQRYPVDLDIIRKKNALFTFLSTFFIFLPSVLLMPSLPFTDSIVALVTSIIFTFITLAGSDFGTRLGGFISHIILNSDRQLRILVYSEEKEINRKHILKISDLPTEFVRCLSILDRHRAIQLHNVDMIMDKLDILKAPNLPVKLLSDRDQHEAKIVNDSKAFTKALEEVEQLSMDDKIYNSIIANYRKTKKSESELADSELAKMLDW